MKNEIKNIIKFCSNKFCIGFLIAVVFFITVFSIFYNIAVKKALSTFINQMFGREELAVSSGANSIHVFLEMAKNSLLLLSRNPSVIEQDTETQKVLDRFAADWAGTPILGVAYFDKEGNTLFIANNVGESIEIASDVNVSDREFFDWAREADKGDTYLDKPLMPRVKSSRTQYIFTLATPIFRDEEFNGVLALAISLRKLTGAYLDPLKVSPDCRVYIMHPDGTILATLAGYDELVRIDYFEYLQNNPYPGSKEAAQLLKKALEDDNVGRLDVVLYSPIEEGPARFLIAYAPVKYNNKQWTLGVAVPIENVKKNFEPLKETSIMLFSIVILFIMTLSTMGILLAKASRKKAYSDNLKEGKERTN